MKGMKDESYAAPEGDGPSHNVAVKRGVAVRKIRRNLLPPLFPPGSPRQFNTIPPHKHTPVSNTISSHPPPQRTLIKLL